PRFQSHFYRDLYHRMLKILIFLVSIILVLVLLNLYLIFFPKTREYYVSTTNGQLYQWCISQNRFVGLGTCGK
ncbi:MAG TPA: hypothetical protein VHM20_01670, partial [Gammaproteobacteria bacterium]|nr:hypothetical protein [Gammaproteobacteria bacterium]